LGSKGEASHVAMEQAGDEMTESFPEFAVNWQAVFRKPATGSGDSKRMMGLHPDTPLSGRTLRELQSTGLE
jgi:hypothetical protein